MTKTKEATPFGSVRCAYAYFFCGPTIGDRELDGRESYLASAGIHVI